MNIHVNFDLFDSKCFTNYLNFLTGRIFKILPISETEPNTLIEYMSSLQIELLGNIDLIEKIKFDSQFLSLVGTLQYLINNEVSHSVLRREVLKCTNITQQLLLKYKDGD